MDDVERKQPQPMTLAEARAFAERLADRDGNKMEFIGSRRWDAYRYVVPAVIAALGLLKPDEDADVLAVRRIMHAQQRAMTPPDSGWGNMSYKKGSYDDTPQFQAALASAPAGDGVEEAVAHLMATRRIGTASLNEHQRDADDAKMREAYRDILTKAVPFLARPRAAVGEREREAAQRLQSLAGGAELLQVYGPEWCMFPTVQMRADLSAILALQSPPAKD